LKNFLSEEYSEDNEDADIDDGEASISIVSRSNVDDDDDDDDDDGTFKPTLENEVVKPSTRLLLLHIAKVARSAIDIVILHIIVTTAMEE